MDKKSLIKRIIPILLITALLLIPVMSGMASACTVSTGTPPIKVGVYVGEKLVYRVVVTYPPQTPSVIFIITITGISNTPPPEQISGYTHGDLIIAFSVTEISSTGISHFTAYEDLTAGGNVGGLGPINIFPADITKGTFDFGGLTFTVQTKTECGSIIDYATVSFPPSSGITGTITYEWYQATGVVTYIYINSPILGVGSFTLLGYGQNWQHGQCR